MPDRRGPTLDFVTTPTESWLRESLKDCRSRLLVASPYVNEAFSQVLRGIPPSIKTTLVTKTDLRDFAMGSCNLETLYTLARQGVRVMSLHALHAKVYVLDRRRALITSANATWSGMRRNLECGVAIDQQAAVGRVARLVLSGFGADSPPKPISAYGLSRLRQPVEAIRTSAPAIPPIRVPETPEAIQDPSFQLADVGEFLKSFTGWTRLTLECVLSLPNDTFSLSEIYAVCIPVAERRYPLNRNIQAKVRQMLQDLCSLGLIERLRDGVYRRTATG